jgi:SNF2 family DNA or RNA helicase
VTTATLTLHDYQLVAQRFLQGQDRAALFLDMGLGKTAVVLTALEPRHLPALVVAPKRVAENVWGAERDLWRPDLSISIAAGSPIQRGDALRAGADITVIGRDNLRDVLRMRPRPPWATFVIDELSGYKNRASVRWKTAKKIADDVPYLWGLTGTPAPNGYHDLWAQIALLDGGARLGKNITTYRSRYFRPGRQIANGTIVSWELREESEAHIKTLIEDICLSMESDGRVELPPFTVNPVAVELPSAVKKVYNTLAKDLVVNLKAIFGGEIHSAANASVLSNRLTQVTAGFLYVDESAYREPSELGTGDTAKYTPLHTEKIKALEEIIDSAQGSGVLVFYRYRAEREMLLGAISAARTIDEPDVIAAWNRGEVPVLIAHPASAGHGLNLQHGGHTAVWTSLDWDLELWEQANKRLHRQGQKHPVVAHVLLANRSVDHLVRRRVEEKADVQDDLLEYLRSPI